MDSKRIHSNDIKKRNKNVAAAVVEAVAASSSSARDIYGSV